MKNTSYAREVAITRSRIPVGRLELTHVPYVDDEDLGYWLREGIFEELGCTKYDIVTIGDFSYTYGDIMARDMDDYNDAEFVGLRVMEHNIEYVFR